MAELGDELFQPLVAQLDLEQKVSLLTGRDSWSLHAVPEIGLDSIVLSDGPAGVRGATWDERSPSINFPSPTSVAASWSHDVVEAVGSALGSEARRKGVHVVLAPTINLHRTPFGGRHFEAFSEDPFLTSELATAYVQGIQAHGVGATVKHYVANDSETDRFTVDVRVDERTLRELYLLAFEKPVTVGPSWLVMSAYNSVNGSTASENALLSTPLTDEWGFDGVVVSDWTAVRSVESARHPQDLAMPGPDGAWGDALVAAVRTGSIDERIIDRKIVRILRLAARVGALDGFVAVRSVGPIDESESRAIARRAAGEGTVLLKNQAALPLHDPQKIALIGEGARYARTQGGGSATVIPSSVVSPLEGIRERWPSAAMSWSLGAVVQSGLADLDPSTFETLDGDPGMTVHYLDEQGATLLVEQRLASGIVSFDASALASRSALVEMRLRYRPENPAPTIPFAVAGLSDFEVMADGKRVAAGSLRTAEGDDPATAVLNPPHRAISLPVSGDSVDLIVRFTPVSGGIPGALAFRVGVPPLQADPEVLIEEAVEAARQADVAIVVVSTSAEVESEGFDRTSLQLPGAQDALVRAVAEVNPRTIVVVNSGAPVLLPWIDRVAAALAVWFPGQEFGQALADVLSGDAEPGGRLPVTWPSNETDLPVRTVTPTDGQLGYEEGLHIGYRAWLQSGAVPAFPFGHGLGYTDWVIDEIAVTGAATADVPAVATACLRNTGASFGKAVVQFYLERTSASDIDRPARWLAGFGTVYADSGEAVTVSVPLDPRRFAHWAGGWEVESGDYTLRAGFSSADLPVHALIVAAVDEPALAQHSR